MNGTWYKQCTVAILAALFVPMALAANEPELVREDYIFRSSLDNTGPLYATAIYPKDAGNLPVMIVMHGYWGNRTKVYFSAERFARQGYFCLAIQTRGWGGEIVHQGRVIERTEKSAGANDDGGLETHDIYDGLNAAIERYKGKLDPERVAIAGYSNGGAMAYFASVRFPFLFQAAAAFFGIPDYGRWIELNRQFAPLVEKAVGATPREAPDRYTARSATRAAGNLSGTLFHIVHDSEETLCPLEMVREFIAALRRNEYGDELVVHESGPGDRHRWIHGYNRSTEETPEGFLSPVEDRFVADLSQRGRGRPAMPDRGELTVLGFLVTPKFTCVAGSGENAVARLAYDIGEDRATLRFAAVTSKADERLVITLHGDTWKGMTHARIDGRQVPLAGEEPRTITATIDSTVVIE